MNNIITGDSLEVLKTLEDNSIDAVVTDPPYGLSFMGKKWDYDVPSTELWAECLRVLKPGGYLLAFAGTRTQHRMAVRIEDAGFEIRDMIAWVYGSGFPKSLDVSKQIDKAAGHARATEYEPNHKNGTFGKGMGGGKHGAQSEPPITEAARQWQGWGTALKPALEPITVARKPISEKTVAENVLKWGTGGIDIDGSRVGTGEDKGMWPITNREIKGNGVGENQIDARETDLSVGRWPANLIHDGSDEVVGLFPDTKSVASKRGGATNGNGKNNDYGDFNEVDKYECGFNDSGSASRFFYCAKASRAERGGSTHPTMKPIRLMEYLVKLVSRENAVILDPFLGSGTTAIACKNTNRKYIGIERDPEYVKIAEARIKTGDILPEPTNQGVE